MMRKLLVMVSIGLGLTMLTVVICDIRNPMMGFLLENPARIFIAALSICAIAEGIILGYDPKGNAKSGTACSPSASDRNNTSRHAKPKHGSHQSTGRRYSGYDYQEE